MLNKKAMYDKQVTVWPEDCEQRKDWTVFALYNEAGQRIEGQFETPKEAETWAQDNGFEVVEMFGYQY